MDVAHVGSKWELGERRVLSLRVRVCCLEKLLALDRQTPRPRHGGIVSRAVSLFLSIVVRLFGFD